MIMQLNTDMSLDIDKVSKVVVIMGKHILLLRKDNNEWELPGGHLTLGEKYREGAIREVMEETGLAINIVNVLRKSYNFRLYLARVQKAGRKLPEVILSNEHTKYRWVTLSQVCKLKLSKKTKLNINSIISGIG